MRINLLAIVLTFLIVNQAISQNLPQNAGDTGREFLKALTDRNIPNLQALMGHDFLLVSFDGQTVDSGTLLEALGNNYVSIESGNSYSNYTRYYQDTGIVTGLWDVRGAIQGQSFANRLSYTLVVVRQGGAWKVVSVHFTPS